MVNYTSNILFPFRKDEKKCECRKYQNFVFDRAFHAGWLFFYIFDHATQSAVALKNIYLAFISSSMANYYIFFFSFCINSRGVV